MEPGLGSEAVSALKNSSHASVIAVEELTLRSTQLASSTFDFFSIFLASGVMYLALTGAVSALQLTIEAMLDLDRPRPLIFCAACCPGIGRLCPPGLKFVRKLSIRIAELSQHQPDGSQSDECEGITAPVLKILGQSTAPVKPGEGAFDYPAPGQNLKALGRIRTFDYFNGQPRQQLGEFRAEFRPIAARLSEGTTHNQTISPSLLFKPSVSTTICRFLPLIFLPAS